MTRNRFSTFTSWEKLLLKLSNYPTSYVPPIMNVSRCVGCSLMFWESQLSWEILVKLNKLTKLMRLESWIKVRITPKINSYLRKLHRCPFSISTVTPIMTRMHSGEKSKNDNDEDARMSIHWYLVGQWSSWPPGWKLSQRRNPSIIFITIWMMMVVLIMMVKMTIRLITIFVIILLF